ncbi:hypothetical protein RRG08_034777 [Elysia crispata]|uniref:Uncharacterized protein n=1 Tax=Elysia crispata TaxID=231223 RepID=A0AAE0YAJ9_9GAST|nr:hypothetical protein RRG08_034777 [Elysia crispata]
MKKRNRKGKPKDEINLGQRITTERDMIDEGSSNFLPLFLCVLRFISAGHTRPSVTDILTSTLRGQQTALLFWVAFKQSRVICHSRLEYFKENLKRKNL